MAFVLATLRRDANSLLLSIFDLPATIRPWPSSIIAAWSILIRSANKPSHVAPTRAERSFSRYIIRPVHSDVNGGLKYVTPASAGSDEGADMPLVRPDCPKCSMHMIAASEVKDGKQTFECLRCGYTEERKVD
jgi:hypothetical protein